MEDELNARGSMLGVENRRQVLFVVRLGAEYGELHIELIESRYETKSMNGISRRGAECKDATSKQIESNIRSWKEYFVRRSALSLIARGL